MNTDQSYHLVSITVGTYNSSKYVLETLESIKVQTYQHLELIISDDCSTDNTVQICKDWISRNGDRFVRAIVLESPVNTGVSGNGNRARRACQGEWVKGIAGDDLMVPECIELYIDFVRNNPGASFIFAKFEAFGPNEKFNEMYNSGQVFNYRLFSLSPDEQYKHIIFNNEHIPAATFFYNREAMSKLGVINDERIPFAEDEAKWLNMLKKGANFSFIDAITVMYRVGHPESLSSNGGVKRTSVERYRSKRAYNLFYKFPEHYRKDPDSAIEQLIDYETSLYGKYFQMAGRYESAISSWAYRVGKVIVFPFSWAKQLLMRIKENH